MPASTRWKARLRRPGDALENYSSTMLPDIRAGDLPGSQFRIPLRFPGMFHMEIIQERLEREYDLDSSLLPPRLNTSGIGMTAVWWISIHQPPCRTSPIAEVRERG